MAIITNTDIKSYLNISTTDNDSFIDTLISEAQNYVEEYCRQKFEAQDITINFFGDSNNIFGNDLRLNNQLVNSIVSLEYKEEIEDASYTEIASTKYTLIDKDKVYYLNSKDGWTAGYYYKLVYNAGFATVPGTIKNILTEMVAVNYQKSNISAGGKNRLGLGSESESRHGSSLNTNFKDLLPDWHKKLNKFKVYL